MKKLFVFDWNGTLLNDSDVNLLGFNETLKIFGVSPVSMDHYRETMDFPLVHMYTRNGIHVDDYLARFQQATDTFFEHYRPAAKACALKEGTVELLEFLTDQGFDLMILSNQNEMDLRDQIAERHITQYFKIISGNQDNSVTGYTMTNKLQRLEKILSENPYVMSQSYIIGDSLEEPEIAHRLGMKAISVTWGCFSRERLEKSTTNHIIDDLAEVSNILQKSDVKEAV